MTRSHRNLRTPRLLVVGVLGVLLVGALVLAVGSWLLRDHTDAGPRGTRTVFRAGRDLEGPDAGLDWWAPVHGEPLGVAADGTDVAAAALDEVRLLDVATGRARWKASLPGVRRYRPAVAGNRVAATSETELVLFDRRDGSRVATAPFAGPGPAAVLPMSGRSPLVVAGSETGAITAVDADTGAPRWAATYPGSVTVAPQAESGVVIASWHGSAGATIRALDPADGTVRWQATAGPVASAPAVAPGLVLFADGIGVHSAAVRALDARTGQERWRAELAGWFDDELEPVVDGSRLYIFDGMGAVTALDLASGKVQWREETGRPLVSGRLVLTKDAVVFPSYDDELMVLDRATGRLRSSAIQSGVPVDVAAADGRLVVALRLGAPSRIEAQTAP